ncbi:PepSY domain-containing protein [Thermomonas sp.]|uniref:PepSY domain-containing protein n=1 Tax=Thermomonas sp. TaxID=1971895 RepID=UPI00391A1878
MSCRSSHLPTLMTIAVLVALPAVAAAQAGPQARDRGRPDLRDRDDLPPPASLSDAVRRVERNTRGEVLSAERIQFDGRDMHRVKVIDDQGRVRVFMQEPVRRDAATARPDRVPRDDDGN